MEDHTLCSATRTVVNAYRKTNDTLLLDQMKRTSNYSHEQCMYSSLTSKVSNELKLFLLFSPFCKVGRWGLGRVCHFIFLTAQCRWLGFEKLRLLSGISLSNPSRKPAF